MFKEGDTQMNERIDAPQRVLDAINRAQDTIDRLQAEAQALVFGAAIGLGVPDGWVWDGRGWHPPHEQPEQQQQQ